MAGTPSKRMFECVLLMEQHYLQGMFFRLNCLRTGYNVLSKYRFCCILSDHFHKGICRNAIYKFQILEKLEGNGRTMEKTEVFWTLPEDLEGSNVKNHGCLS